MHSFANTAYKLKANITSKICKQRYSYTLQLISLQNSNKNNLECSDTISKYSKLTSYKLKIRHKNDLS